MILPLIASTALGQVTEPSWSLVSSSGLWNYVSVICCCVTNLPKTQWLKATITCWIIILYLSRAILALAQSWLQPSGRMFWGWRVWDGLIHTLGAKVLAVIWAPLSAGFSLLSCLAWASFAEAGIFQEGEGRSCQASCGRGTSAWVSHSIGQRKPWGRGNGLQLLMERVAKSCDHVVPRVFLPLCLLWSLG